MSRNSFMSRNSLLTARVLAVALAGVLAAGPALADKPSWAGGKGKGNDQGENHDGQRGKNHKVEHFGDQHRTAVHDYYEGQYKSGHCPPGLAKKHNGCMPPGQAKKWQVGQRLPSNVIYYEVPRPLVTQLGQAPAGYRYVRVGGDILLLKTNTALIVDVIQNLGKIG